MGLIKLLSLPEGRKAREGDVKGSPKKKKC